MYSYYTAREARRILTDAGYTVTARRDNGSMAYRVVNPNGVTLRAMTNTVGVYSPDHDAYRLSGVAHQVAYGRSQGSNYDGVI